MGERPRQASGKKKLPVSEDITYCQVRLACSIGQILPSCWLGISQLGKRSTVSTEIQMNEEMLSQENVSESDDTCVNKLNYILFPVCPFSFQAHETNIWLRNPPNYILERSCKIK